MNPPRRPVLNLSDRRVDLDQHLVFPEVGAVVELSPLEVSLLEFLAARGGEAVERDVLLTEVWGYAPSVQSRAIDKTVHRLRTKLEFDPSDPQHLQGVRGLGYRLVGVTVSADEAPRSNLSAPLTPGFGLDAPISRVRELLAAPGAVVAVTGPTGSGRTRLGAELGAALFAEGWSAFGVDLSGCSEPDAAAERLAEAVGAHWSPALTPLEASARALGRGGPTLVVLDGATQPLVGALLARLRPRARWLLLSHEPLPQTGAVHLRLPPLSPDDGARLLLDRARRLGATVAEGPALAELSEAIGGHPQSLELLAPRLGLLSAEALLLQVRAALGRRPEARWAVSLGLAVEQQWGALSEVEAEVVAACAAFELPFRATDALAMLPERDPEIVLDALQGASQRGVLSREEGEPPRHSLPGPLRARGLAWLESRGQLARRQRLAAEVLTAEAEDLAREVREGRAAAGYPGLERCREALLSVVTRYTDADPVLASRAALPLSMVQIGRHPPRFAALLGELMARLGGHPLRARLGAVRATALKRAGELVQARSEASALLAEFPDAPPLARAEALLVRVGSSGLAADDPAAVEAELRAALASLEGSNELRMIQRLRTAMGIRFDFAGRPEDALTVYRDVMAFYRRSGDPEGLGQAMNFALSALSRLGCHDEARPLLDEVVSVCRQAQDPLQEVWALSNCAAFSWQSGDLDTMLTQVSAVRQRATELGDGFTAIVTHESLGFIAVERGPLEEARYHFDALERGCERIGAEAVRWSGRTGVALVDHLLGALETAARTYDRAIDFAPERAHRHYLRWILMLRHLLAAERREAEAYARTLEQLQPFLLERSPEAARVYPRALEAAAVLREREDLAAVAEAVASLRAATRLSDGHEARIFLLLLERAVGRRRVRAGR